MPAPAVRQHLLDIAIDAPRLALVMRLAIQRPLGLHDLRREAVDIVGAGLAGGEHPSAGANAACQPRPGVRDRHRQQRLDRDGDAEAARASWTGGCAFGRDGRFIMSFLCSHCRTLALSPPHGAGGTMLLQEPDGCPARKCAVACRIAALDRIIRDSRHSRMARANSRIGE